jgi:hypothetical protein
MWLQSRGSALAPACGQHNRQTTVSTNTPRNPETPLSLKLRANVCKNDGKFGMVLPEESADAADDELTDAQRFWNTVVKPLALDGPADVLLDAALKAWARLENVDATSLYCCTCCDPFIGCSADADDRLFVVAASPELVVPAAGVSPSCVSAAATAEANVSAAVVEPPAGAMRAVGVSLGCFL